MYFLYVSGLWAFFSLEISAWSSMFFYRSSCSASAMILDLIPADSLRLNILLMRLPLSGTGPSGRVSDLDLADFVDLVDLQAELLLFADARRPLILLLCLTTDDISSSERPFSLRATLCELSIPLFWDLKM